MTGTTRSSADLDPRRRKALFRSWHRGMREVDLILGSFADREIARLDEAELGLYEALMADVLGDDGGSAEPDADILRWVTGEAAVPARHDTPVFAKILSYRQNPNA